ncbi:MAG: transporter substrate-binding domain-containing protein [Pseudonocardiaceae bacterium]
MALLFATGCAASADSTSGVSTLDQVRQRGTLLAGVRADNPPHSFIDTSGRHVGFDVDIARAIARIFGVRLEIVKVDELTRISFLEKGTIDVAVASMSKTHKRAEHVDFSQTYFCSFQTFLVRTGSAASLEDLAIKPVAMDRGSSAVANWKTWLAGHGHSDSPQIEEFSEKRAAVEAVRHGNLAGYAEDYEILASFAKDDPTLTVLDQSIGVKLDGIGIRQGDSQMREAVDFALQDLTASGEWRRIYDQWFGPNSTTPVPLQCEPEVWPRG